MIQCCCVLIVAACLLVLANANSDSAQTLDLDDDDPIGDSFRANSENDVHEAFHADDFEPTHVLTFEAEDAETCFYQDVDGDGVTLPLRFRCSFFVSHGTTKVEAFRLDPYDASRRIPKATVDRDDDGVFAFDATDFGTYGFCFYASRTLSRHTPRITFAFHLGSEAKTPLADDHLSPLRAFGDEAALALSRLESEANYVLIRQRAQMDEQDEVWRVTLLMALLSTIVAIAAAGAHYVFVVRFVDGRTRLL